MIVSRQIDPIVFRESLDNGSRTSPTDFENIGATAAVQGVVAAPLAPRSQGVVAGPPVQGVVAVATGQEVVVVIPVQPVVAVPPPQGVVAVPPVQGVVAVTRPQGVVAATSAQGVVAGISVQSVVALATGQGVAAVLPYQRVVAFAADQGIVAGTAGQTVVASAAFQPDRPAVAPGYRPGIPSPQSIVAVAAIKGLAVEAECVGVDLVGVVRALDHLESRDGVADGIAGVPIEIRVDYHPPTRPGIGQEVDPGAAVQEVRPPAAFDPVVALPAIERVTAPAADERVGVVRALDFLESRDGVALGMAAEDGPGRQAHRHPRIRPGIGQEVDPGAPVQGVRPRAAMERVVAPTAAQPIVAVAAVDPVVALVADERVVGVRAGDRGHCRFPSRTDFRKPWNLDEILKNPLGGRIRRRSPSHPRW